MNITLSSEIYYDPDLEDSTQQRNLLEGEAADSPKTPEPVADLEKSFSLLSPHEAASPNKITSPARSNDSVKSPLSSIRKSPITSPNVPTKSPVSSLRKSPITSPPPDTVYYDPTLEESLEDEVNKEGEKMEDIDGETFEDAVENLDTVQDLENKENEEISERDDGRVVERLDDIEMDGVKLDDDILYGKDLEQEFFFEVCAPSSNFLSIHSVCSFIKYT